MGEVMCRLCSKAVKSVAYVLAGRTALAQNKVAHAPRLITKYTIQTFLLLLLPLLLLLLFGIAMKEVRDAGFS